MNNRNPNRKSSPGSLIGLAIVLMVSEPVLFIPLVIFAGLIWLATKGVSKLQQGPSRSRQEKFDDCPQPLFCFHKDKGEHHVKRGKEIDPWDRPDIDISKYQRNR